MSRRPALALCLLALALAGCGGNGGGEGKEATATTETAAEPAGSIGSCEQVDPPDPRSEESRPAPDEGLEAGKTYELVFRTSCGEFTVTLDLELAPKTAASLVALAEDDYFDGTGFHRIVPGFVIQGGDPTGTGTSGPGYQTTDVPPSNARYTKGVVAMAKTAAEPPGTAGSQFFVVTGGDAGLPPEYAIAGRVTDGLEVVERIGKLGDPATEQPTRPVVIEDVAVETS